MAKREIQTDRKWMEKYYDPYKTSIWDVAVIEAFDPAHEIDVIRCPLCESRCFDLFTIDHYKAGNEYRMVCVACHTKFMHPFYNVWRYSEDQKQQLKQKTPIIEEKKCENVIVEECTGCVNLEHTEPSPPREYWHCTKGYKLQQDNGIVILHEGKCNDANIKLEDIILYEEAPLVELKKRFPELRRLFLDLGDNWDEDGAKPFTDITQLDFLEMFLIGMYEKMISVNFLLSIPHILPVCNNSIDINWQRREDKYRYSILINIPLSGLVSFVGVVCMAELGETKEILSEFDIKVPRAQASNIIAEFIVTWLRTFFTDERGNAK